MIIETTFLPAVRLKTQDAILGFPFAASVATPGNLASSFAIGIEKVVRKQRCLYQRRAPGKPKARPNQPSYTC